MRSVICHYHIYKNAGTSVDHVLRHSFGDRHLGFDGPFPFFTIDQEQLDRIILRKAAAAAFSSHQIVLPAPVSGQYRIMSVAFLRHPLLRIASVWRFKRRERDGTETSRLAAAHDFADWLRRSLADPQEIAQVSNVQTRHLGARFRERARMRRYSGCVEYDLVTAEENLRSVTCLGLAEEFEPHARRLASIAAGFGLPIRLPADLHRNATDASAEPPDMRVARLLEALPADLRQQMIAANEQDLALYGLASALLQTAEAA